MSAADADLFDCPRRQSLRILPTFCAMSWRAGKRLPAKSLEPAAACKGCPIGARHAGESVQASLAVSGNAQICTRCGQAATKLIRQSICVSCFNREREVIRGRNRRGTKPIRARPLKAAAAEIATLEDGKSLRKVNLAHVAHDLETAASIARSVNSAVVLYPINNIKDGIYGPLETARAHGGAATQVQCGTNRS